MDKNKLRTLARIPIPRRKISPRKLYEKLESDTIENIISLWKHEDAAQSVRDLMTKFGPPDDAMKDLILWRNISQFKETWIRDESLPHNFPTPHRDWLYSTMDIPIPADWVGVFAGVTGSIIVDGLKNQVTARCQTITKNAVTLGFVQDAIDGKFTPQKAKDEYAKRINNDITPDWFKEEK